MNPQRIPSSVARPGAGQASRELEAQARSDVSDITGTAHWTGPLAGSAGKRSVWLDGLIALVALLVLGNLVSDLSLDVNYGWDARVNCAAVDAHASGLDPYFVKNLKDTKLSYPYLPVTLDAFRPVCAGGFLVGHHRGVFLLLAMLCSLLLPGVGRDRGGPRTIALRMLWALGAFVGFEWVTASGNFTIMSGTLSAAALALLFRSLRRTRTTMEALARAWSALRCSASSPRSSWSTVRCWPRCISCRCRAGKRSA